MDGYTRYVLLNRYHQPDVYAYVGHAEQLSALMKKAQFSHNPSPSPFLDP